MANRTTMDLGLATGGGSVLRVVVLSGEARGFELALDRPLVVGSSPDADLVVPDAGVSRRHAQLTPAVGGADVEDLASRNGTFLGQARIERGHAAAGLVVRVGNTSLGLQPTWLVRDVLPSLHRRFGELVGESVATREAFALLERVAQADITVLFEGETGTGKSAAARMLHRASARAQGPFVAFDGSAFASERIEGELFEGALVAAHGGTLVLEEPGRLPLEVQARLLTAIESGRLGDRPVDVRVLANSSRDLAADARRGTFRWDLFYRLAIVRIRLAPLRERTDDLPLLVHEILKVPLEDVRGPNLDRLLAYPWPGNVRELQGVLLRASTLADSPIHFDDLRLGVHTEGTHGFGITYPGVVEPMPFKDAKDQLSRDFERAYVNALLDRHGHNITQAAEAAGISRKHLYALIEKLGAG